MLRHDSIHSFTFSSDCGDNLSQTDNASSAITNSDDETEMHSSKKKSSNYGGLFKFSQSKDQWKVEGVSSRIRDLELIITIQAKIHNEKNGKWINNTFNLTLRQDEPNIQSKIEKFGYRNNIAISEWDSLTNYANMKYNDFLIFNLGKYYIKSIHEMTLNQMSTRKIDGSEMQKNSLRERVEYETKKLLHDIQRNFIYEENLIYEKSSQYEILKKNLLDVLENKRKSLLLEIELL